MISLHSMISLPDVTLIALSGIGHKQDENAEAIEKSCEGINFGAVKYIQLGEIVDIDSWNKAVIYELPKYIETSHCLFIHGDAEITNPYLWNDKWLEYDYCGSPWPLPTDDYSYKTPNGRLIRVGNSVSLRSKKLMDLVATRTMEYHYGNNNEDGQICVWERDWLEEQGMKFMPFEESLDFGMEHELPEHKGRDTFLIHSL